MPLVSPVAANEVLVLAVKIATEFQTLSAAPVMDARLETVTVLLTR